MKINNGITFKNNNKKQGSVVVKIRTGKNVAMYTETIKKQQAQVKIALEKVLALQIFVERYGIKIKLIPQIRYNFNTKQKERLRNAVVKYKQVLSNMVGFRIVEINNINSPIKKLDNKMIFKLIVDMKIMSREKIFLAIEKSW